MPENGFAIRCPHCRRWRVWKDLHPENVAVNSVEELKKILRTRHSIRSGGEAQYPAEKKLLRCSSPRWACPASFEALVCRTKEHAAAFLKIIDAWTFKRGFRLYKADRVTRWDDKAEREYYGILFCTELVPRLEQVELEVLIDRELLRRLIAGISVEIKAPLTIFAANVFSALRDKPQILWMPIEAYFEGIGLVPPHFNAFCRTCREITMKSLTKDFESDQTDVENCPIGFGADGKCAGREAACMRWPKDWNHCPAFLKRRMADPCYCSDLSLIETIYKKLGEGVRIEEGIRHRCHAGFTKVAFPIVVHDYLAGVAMTGQFILDRDHIADTTDFVRRWEILRGHDDLLEAAKAHLIRERLSGGREEGFRFFTTDVEIEEKLALLWTSIEEIRQMADSRYRDFRGKTEAVFRQEMLGLIQSGKQKAGFFEKHAPNALERMREFWAFEVAYLGHYSYETKMASVIAHASKGEGAVSPELPRLKLGKLDPTRRLVNPSLYLYNKGEGLPASSPDLFSLARLFDTWTELTNPKVHRYYAVLVPFFEEVYGFAFGGQDKESMSRLTRRAGGGVSQLCQDQILETCTQVIYEFGDVWYREARERAWREFSAIASHRIGNEISSVDIFLDVLSIDLMRDSKFRRKYCEKLFIIHGCIARAKEMLRDQASLTAEIKPQPRIVSLANLLRKSTLGVLSAEENVKFIGSAARERVFVDPNLMEQVFKELAKNAVAAGGREVEISVGAHKEDDVIHVYLADSGPGISAEDRDRVFQPYVSLSEGGTGLGLTTVRRILQAHNGNICAVPSERGAKFDIELPLKGRVQ